MGTFATPVFIDPRDNQSSTSIRVADLNGDGKTDIVTADAVLINDGTGHFAVTTRPRAISFDIGDVNGDGKTDIVEDAQPRVAGSPLMVRPGNGDGERIRCDCDWGRAGGARNWLLSCPA